MAEILNKREPYLSRFKLKKLPGRPVHELRDTLLIQLEANLVTIKLDVMGDR